MRGVGGPLLSIGDLLSDVGGAESLSPPSPSPLLSSPGYTTAHSSSDLPKLFQEDYNKLNEALTKGDHSWTALTLKLCSSLEMANTLVQSTNTNSRLLLDKIGELEEILKRGDSAVAAAKAICISSHHSDSRSFGRDPRE
ncbi:hypothetical protein MLD38_000187 [Melastoma candidum]|uniref:Uncharacterized protein n=1 Tax=Melastoma candidum TaxID=119954 RepID=A0ACB9SA78_9MYRT|nr:hypothetical protein MLD38_000187 [Melastoma candidum]